LCGEGEAQKSTLGNNNNNMTHEEEEEVQSKSNINMEVEVAGTASTPQVNAMAVPLLSQQGGATMGQQVDAIIAAQHQPIQALLWERDYYHTEMECLCVGNAQAVHAVPSETEQNGHCQITGQVTNGRPHYEMLSRDILTKNFAFLDVFEPGKGNRGIMSLAQTCRYFRGDPDNCLVDYEMVLQHGSFQDKDKWEDAYLPRERVYQLFEMHNSSLCRGGTGQISSFALALDGPLRFD
jgi:hypothetical protein